MRIVRRTLIASLILAVSFAAWGAGIGAWIVRASRGNASLPADCGLVFGAAVHPGESPGPGILRRTTTAARLYREGKLRMLILTGGSSRPDEDSEAEVMRRVALLNGVDAGDIVLESAARSTWENLALSKPLAAGCSSVIAISDGYHLARIRYLASRQGWGELPTVPSDARASAAFELRSIAREILAFMFYVLRGETLTGGAGLPNFRLSMTRTHSHLHHHLT